MFVVALEIAGQIVDAALEHRVLPQLVREALVDPLQFAVELVTQLEFTGCEQRGSVPFGKLACELATAAGERSEAGAEMAAERAEKLEHGPACRPKDG